MRSFSNAFKIWLKSIKHKQGVIQIIISKQFLARGWKRNWWPPMWKITPKCIRTQRRRKRAMFSRDQTAESQFIILYVEPPPKKTVFLVLSSKTDEVWAKRDPSLCNESVNGHFWSDLCLNCIFKWTWFVKTDIWSVIDGSRVRFPVEAALLLDFFPHFSLFFDSAPLLLHSNFQSWQMRCLPILDSYGFFTKYVLLAFQIRHQPPKQDFCQWLMKKPWSRESNKLLWKLMTSYN